MYKSKMSTIDGMFEDALYRSCHDNIVNIDIHRSMDTYKVKIIFNILNFDGTKIIQDIQHISNRDITQCSIQQITSNANKFAGMIDKVPDYIPDEQIIMWLKCKV